MLLLHFMHVLHGTAKTARFCMFYTNLHISTFCMDLHVSTGFHVHDSACYARFACYYIYCMFLYVLQGSTHFVWFCMHSMFCMDLHVCSCFYMLLQVVHVFALYCMFLHIVHVLHGVV